MTEKREKCEQRVILSVISLNRDWKEVTECVLDMLGMWWVPVLNSRWQCLSVGQLIFHSVNSEMTFPAEIHDVRLNYSRKGNKTGNGKKHQNHMLA